MKSTLFGRFSRSKEITTSKNQFYLQRSWLLWFYRFFLYTNYKVFQINLQIWIISFIYNFTVVNPFYLKYNLSSFTIEFKCLIKSVMYLLGYMELFKACRSITDVKQRLTRLWSDRGHFQLDIIMPIFPILN